MGYKAAARKLVPFAHRDGQSSAKIPSRNGIVRAGCDPGGIRAPLAPPGALAPVRRNVLARSGSYKRSIPVFKSVEHGESSRLLNFGLHCRLRSLDPYSRHKFQCAGFVDLRCSHSHSGGAPEHFRSHLEIRPPVRGIAFVCPFGLNPPRLAG